MTPGSFDPQTAREVVGDAVAREIESGARSDADRGAYSPPKWLAQTYWDRVRASMAEVVYREQFSKRSARNARKAASDHPKP